MGCMDPVALNFDSSADVHVGGCVYAQPGCTDSLATNHLTIANVMPSTLRAASASALPPFCAAAGGIPKSIPP